MRQFDVCRNLSGSRTAAPYLVIVQSGEFDRFGRRLVVPLLKLGGLPKSFAPEFEIEGVDLTADALLLFSIPVRHLGPVVASLAGEQSASLLTNAIDRVLSRVYS